MPSKKEFVMLLWRQKGDVDECQYKRKRLSGIKIHIDDKNLQSLSLDPVYSWIEIEIVCMLEKCVYLPFICWQEIFPLILLVNLWFGRVQ